MKRHIMLQDHPVMWPCMQRSQVQSWLPAEPEGEGADEPTHKQLVWYVPLHAGSIQELSIS